MTPDVVSLTRRYLSFVELSTFAHATEDETKVLDAVKNIIPADYLEQVLFSKNNLKGEYGNSILLFRTHIKQAEVAQSILESLASKLSALDKEALLSEFDMHLEKGKLFIRLDKQSASRGLIRLGNADPIRMRAKFKTSRVEEIHEICRKIGLLP